MGFRLGLVGLRLWDLIGFRLGLVFDAGRNRLE